MNKSLDQPFSLETKMPKTIKKQVCDFCSDFIVGNPRSIERPFMKRKGYICYKYFSVDEGCWLLLEKKGLVEEVFLQDISFKA